MVYKTEERRRLAAIAAQLNLSPPKFALDAVPNMGAASSDGIFNVRIMFGITMQTRRRQPSNDWTKGSKGVISFFVLFLALGFLLYQLFSSVLFAMGYSSGAGSRSFAAALFPLTVFMYLGFIARIQSPTRESRAPIINSFIVFLLWTMLVLGVDINNETPYFPIEELLYSLTLAAMLWRYKYRGQFKALIACCYGVLAGTMAAVIVFGINPVAM